MAAVPEIPKTDEERLKIVTLALSDLIYLLVNNMYTQKLTTITPEIIILAKGVIGKLFPHYIADNYIKYSHKFWPQIKARNRSFLIDNANKIFGDLPTSHVDAFKLLFSSTKLSADGKSQEYLVEKKYEDACWAYFESMTKIAIKYVHRKRGPKVTTLPTGGTKHEYTVQHLQDVDLETNRQMFNVTLEW